MAGSGRYIIKGDPRCGLCGGPLPSGDYWIPLSEKRPHRMVAVCRKCAESSTGIYETRPPEERA